MKKSLRIWSCTVAVVIILGFSIGVVQAGNCELPDFASAGFSNPLTIDNPYMPLEPGTTFTYEPVPNPDDVVNKVMVTDEVKQITVGDKTIDCRVVVDYEMDGNLLAEYTYDWYAQDDEGNVWYCGEDTIEYEYDEEGNLVGTSNEGSWEAGKDVADLGVTALPGYVMLAEGIQGPGECYQQEFYPDQAQDQAKIMRLNATVNLQSGYSYYDCLETKEWSPIELGAIEQKFYAEGVGLVLNFEHHGKRVRNELISISHSQ